MDDITTLYDKDMNPIPIAYLENATKVGYKRKFNDLWTATFSLPADDPKNDLCQPFRIVELYDHGERVDLFRIIKPSKARASDGTQIITYTCEHVLATLINDVLDGYHQIGNLGIYTSDVIRYILSFQTVKLWQFGTVDPDLEHQFEYKWEKQKTLLGPLFSITKPFIEPYQWKWDTTTKPWTINLIKPDDNKPCRMRYGRNLKNITQNVDASKVVTRLTPYGYGDGVNQLDISGVNPTGERYIDTDTQDQFGIIADIWVDKRFENAQSLMDTAKANLEVLKLPTVSYKADGADIYQITKDDIDKFEEGRLVYVTDETLGIDFSARVVSVDRPDTKGDPGAVTVEIANKIPDITIDLSNIKNRQDIHDVYAQGATNIYTYPFDGNCDASFPAVQNFYIPPEAVRINKIYVSLKTDKFRGYVRGMKSAGQVVKTVTSGPSSASTTESGGGKTSGSSSTSTTASGGGKTSGSSSTSTTASGGGKTSAAGGDHNHLMFKKEDVSGPVVAYRYKAGAGDFVELQSSGTDLTTYGSSGDHTHTLPDHSHGMNHTHNLPNHSHGMAHNHSIPDHTHKIPHTHDLDLEIAPHVHEQEFGIWEAPTLPETIRMEVDGNNVPGVALSEDNLDIKPYLTKDSNGAIAIGATHEIKIYPSDLARVSANVFIQIFIQSRG